MTIYTRSSAILVALLFAVPAFAQTAVATTSISSSAPSTPPPSLYETSTATPKPAGLSSCFDYYRFGSVQASVSPSLSSVAQGSAIAFTGTVNNQNNYPIVDATVYVKIFHDRTGNIKNVNGPDVVDWFPAVAHVTLKANESKPISFTWQVPYDADPGSYKAAMYVDSSDRFELSGLVFTDDVTGSMEPFSVVGNTSGDTHFDKAGVMVNDTPFYFAAYPPTIASTTKTVTVSARVMNTSGTPYAGTLSWKLYYWDQLQSSHLIKESSAALNLNAHSTTTLSYAITDTSHAVYYLVGTLTSSASGAKSVIGVRFVRGGVPEPRVNAMGVSAYPLAGSSTAFVCVHSTSNDIATGRVELSVTPVGFFAGLFGPLAHASYSGIIPGDIYALTAPIKGSATSFDLTATLYDQQGSVIDRVMVPYRCNDLGAPCATHTTLIVSIILALLIILGIATLVIRRRAKPTETIQPTV
ncbi:MAG: hypothetical protein ACYC1Y_03265 [Minisyncoccota bacterium]